MMCRFEFSKCAFKKEHACGICCLMSASHYPISGNTEFRCKTKIITCQWFYHETSVKIATVKFNPFACSASVILWLIVEGKTETKISGNRWATTSMNIFYRQCIMGYIPLIPVQCTFTEMPFWRIFCHSWLNDRMFRGFSPVYLHWNGTVILTKNFVSHSSNDDFQCSQ